MKKVLSTISIVAGVSLIFNIEAIYLLQKKDIQIDNLNEKDKQYYLHEKRIECMSHTLMSAYNLSKWEAHYYSMFFDDFSERFKVPWEIFPAVIRIETNFRCTLVSSKGAKGLMQLMEGTGKQMADEIGMDYIEKETLWNDFCNMILGCYYLSKFIKERGLEEAVKIYLGGPGYEKNVAASKHVGQYVGEYKTTVWREFKLLSYMYRGITAEAGLKYEDMHAEAVFDTVKLDLDPFSFMNKPLPSIKSEDDHGGHTKITASNFHPGRSKVVGETSRVIREDSTPRDSGEEIP